MNFIIYKKKLSIPIINNSERLLYIDKFKKTKLCNDYKNIKNKSELNDKENIIEDINLRNYIKKDLNIDPITKESLAKIKGIYYIYDKKINTLKGLENCENLLYLNIQKSNIVNLEPIKDLKNLMNLNLKSNKIEDINPLKKLINLINLDLEHNYIKDINSLSNFKKLRRLSIMSNNINDINPLKELKKLEKLFISANEIENINILKNLKNLKTLWASSNLKLKNIDVLGYLKEINNLDISYIGIDGNINSIKKLKKLKKLTILYANGNSIKYFPHTRG